jgi:hypothetical protein
VSTNARFGFRCDGKHGERRLIEAAPAFLAHCSADPRSEPDRERYLSAFAFPDEFKKHLSATGSTAGYAGRCWSRWLWFDIDRDDPALALADVRRLVGFVLFRYAEFRDDDVLAFTSGAKGFHVGVPLTHSPPPSVEFNAVCKALAELTSTEAGVVIDAGIYDRVRLLRAPNSRHPKTGRHKVRLTHDELMGLSADRIAELSKTPIPFDVPHVEVIPPLLVDDWKAAEAQVRERANARATRTTTTAGRLNRKTVDYIRGGAAAGESRHIALFSAAGNLREFGANEHLITALLEETALDDGLPPKDVARQIRTAIEHADRQAGGGGA